MGAGDPTTRGRPDGAAGRPGHSVVGAHATARRPPWSALLLGAVVAAAYATAFPGAFHFDDWHVIQDNPHVRLLASIPRFFVDPDSTTVLPENKDLRPLVMISLAANHAISGLEPWSYLATNLLLHWVAVLLIFRIVRDHLWLGAAAVPVALGAALLVAVHPLNTEPVNYISARSALLTAVCYLGAFDTALRGRGILSALLLTAAMLTKAIATTLPILVVIYFLFAGRPIPWRRTAGLVAVAGCGLLYRVVLVPHAALVAARQPGMTPWTYVMTEWSAYLYYLRLFLWPDALVVDRADYPFVSSILAPQAWGALLTLLAISAATWAARRRAPALAFAWVWYLVALAAESTVFPLAEAVNEHRPYLGMLGLGTIASLGLWSVARHRPRTFAAALAVVAVPLGLVTAARSRVWRDDRALWEDATQKAPRNERAWLNAGHAALAAGDLDIARHHLERAHALAPCYAYVQLNFSALATREGHLDEALRWADDARRCNPHLALAEYYRATSLERLDRTDDALEAYLRTTELDPAHAEAWKAQGRLLERLGRYDAAAAAYDHAGAADPTAADPVMAAALLYHYRLHDPAAAATGYKMALARDPSHYGALFQLSRVLADLGRTSEAAAAWSAFRPMAERAHDRAALESPPDLRQAVRPPAPSVHAPGTPENGAGSVQDLAPPGDEPR